MRGGGGCGEVGDEVGEEGDGFVEWCRACEGDG